MAAKIRSTPLGEGDSNSELSEFNTYCVNNLTGDVVFCHSGCDIGVAEVGDTGPKKEASWGQEHRFEIFEELSYWRRRQTLSVAPGQNWN